MAEKPRPFRASYLISGVAPEEIFDALLDVPRFPEWAAGLKRARVVDAAGGETSDLRPGTMLEFTLSAASITHQVASTVTVVEPSQRLEWNYVEGATGSGGWLIEDGGTGAVRMTLWTDYRIHPGWLDKIAHRPFFRRLTEDLIRRSLRRFDAHLREG
ncbi:MAG TPA: SRPBCC family protein [Rubrobacter sp.]|nr:SRPBCC family protein [Rubrobacter sp.]